MASPYGDDTIALFEAAAKQRLAEADHLRAAGHFAGAAYLYGYVVELVLKAACNRLWGWPATLPVRPNDRTTMEGLMRDAKLATRSQHDLLGWAQWLVYCKTAFTGGVGYPHPLGFDIVAHADVVHQRWHPDMRYRDLQLPQPDCDAVRNSSHWFTNQYPQL